MTKRSEESLKKAKETRLKNIEEKKKQDELERVQRYQDSQLSDLRKKPLPDPLFNLKVGDKIVSRRIGIREGSILEVLDGGKILKCLFPHTNEKSGKTDSISYESTLDIMPIKTTKDTQFANKDRYRTSISFHNTMLSSLFTYYYSFGIDDSVEYQRDYCWSLRDKEKLIESIFMGIEIGKFALIERKFELNKPSYEILDGKQRLRTIIEFFEDKFKYNGVTYSELSFRDKNYFDNASISLGILKDEDGTFPLKDKLEYFLRLNVGGVVQSEDHLNFIREKLKSL